MPQLLPLVSLSQAEIDHIVAMVPRGASNIQDIYPLSPLQDGNLFHQLMDDGARCTSRDSLMSFAHRGRLDAYIAAVDAVIARHDILRTAVVWDGLAEPVQVVWRNASLIVEEVELALGEGDIRQQLLAQFDPLRYRIDICRAPMMRLLVGRARGAGSARG